MRIGAATATRDTANVTSLANTRRNPEKSDTPQSNNSTN
jgi:hypothetical protein